MSFLGTGDIIFWMGLTSIGLSNRDLRDLISFFSSAISSPHNWLATGLESITCFGSDFGSAFGSVLATSSLVFEIFDFFLLRKFIKKINKNC